MCTMHRHPMYYALIPGRYPMSRTSLESQVSELVDSDACPRPTAGAAAPAAGPAPGVGEEARTEALARGTLLTVAVRAMALCIIMHHNRAATYGESQGGKSV